MPRVKLLAAITAIVVAVAAVYMLYRVGLLQQLKLLAGGGGGSGSGYVVVEADQSFARIASEVPFTLEVYVKVRVLGGSVELCKLRIPDLGVEARLHVVAGKGSEGWLTVEGLSTQPVPITIQLLSPPAGLPDALQVVLVYCDGRTYQVLLPLYK